MSAESNGTAKAPNPWRPDETVEGEAKEKVANPKSVYPFVRFETDAGPTLRIREDELL